MREAKPLNCADYRSIIRVGLRILLSLPPQAEIDRELAGHTPAILAEEGDLVHIELRQQIADLPVVGHQRIVKTVRGGPAQRKIFQNLRDGAHVGGDRAKLVEPEELASRQV